MLSDLFRRDDDLNLYENRTRTFISFCDELICITLTKRLLNLDDLSTRFWLQLFLSIIDDRVRKRFVISLRFRFISVDFSCSSVNVIRSIICEISVNEIIVEDSFIRSFVFCFTFVFRDVSTCKIDLFFHMMFNLRFFVVLTSHWKFQVECLFSQLAHDRWSIAILQSFIECFWAHCSHFFEFLHVLLTWSYRWHLKHCFIRHSFSKYSQIKCVCSFNNSFFIKRFVIFELTILIIKKKNFLRWLMTFFVHVTRSMFRFLCNVLFCLTIFSIVVFWLSVFTLLKRTSCVNTTYVLLIVVVDEIMSFINVKFLFMRVLISSKLASSFKSLLSKRRIENTFLFFFFIVISFCMKFLINKCRISAFFSSLLIFIISVFLRLNFVKIFCCFVFATSSRRAFYVFSVSSKFTAIAYVSMSVFVLNVLLSIRFNFLFMFISFCLMSLFLMNSRESSSSTILSMRKVVESLIVSKLFSFSSLFMFFCICCLRSCKLIRDAMKNDLETSFWRSIDADMIDTRFSLSQCLNR